MEIVCLIENTVFKPFLEAEHGLSFLLKADNFCILFDTGQTGLFLNNASHLQEDLTLVSHVVLSHGHYDHTGGLECFLQAYPQGKVVLKKETLVPKFARSPEGLRDIGFALRNRYETYHDRFAFIEKNCELLPGVFAMTEILSVADFENANEKFLCGTPEDIGPDPFADELFFVIENAEGIIVCTGCSHRGIVNILHTACHNFPARPVQLVVGGFHLRGKNPETIQKTIDALQNFAIQKIGVCHCTGIEEYRLLRNALGSKVFYVSVGDRIFCSP